MARKKLGLLYKILKNCEEEDIANSYKTYLNLINNMETELFNSLKLEKSDGELLSQLFDRIGLPKQLDPFKFQKVFKS